ncbi:SDR family NAD(P)-dependent oxidoreductase [Paenibacillus dakarensis]|uniref:SDR family NAD(P)-dependent oxidoreductase n=1 Tax=Paenibacillus dakarensis TaxID=1527293 RepID=UPI0006D591E1|nr:SDR family NAD(P)-dependent oxidoreductase [Paenibacillus dakarensis]
MNVLVTGAGKGLGLELCKQFNDAGHVIFPLVRSEESARLISREITDKCYPIITDLNNDESIPLIEKVLTSYTDRLDILINNAGIASQRPDFTLNQITTGNISKLFNIHCLGAVRCVLASQSFLLKSSKPLILNISSRLGSLERIANDYYGAEELSYGYRIAKASQNMFTSCLNHELSQKGIATFAIHPGKFRSTTSHGQGEWKAKDAARNIIKWIDTIPIGESGKFIFPNYEEIPW